MTITSKLLVFAVASLTLTGCAGEAPPYSQLQSKSVPKQHAKMLHNPSVIPNEAGPKFHTTNEHGNTTYGMGTSVYSTIGSSGLHSNGFSAHLESRLSTLGISDVRVFVFDDTVVLAAEKREASASQYDGNQKKLLTPMEDQSGKENSSMSGHTEMKSTDTSSHDNLSMAASQIKTLIGGDVKVFTVTGKKAVKAIEQIRADALAKDISPDKIASGIRVLLKLVKEDQRNR